MGQTAKFDMEVEDIKAATKQNVRKILESRENLKDLIKEAEALQDTYDQFVLQWEKNVKFVDYRIAEVQKELEDAQVMMNKNVDKMLFRGESLEDLSKRSETLQDSSNKFAEHAAEVKNKLWWKNFRTLIMGVIFCAPVYTIARSVNTD